MRNFSNILLRKKVNNSGDDNGFGDKHVIFFYDELLLEKKLRMHDLITLVRCGFNKNE